LAGDGAFEITHSFLMAPERATELQDKYEGRTVT
jgi:hypothetical protein